MILWVLSFLGLGWVFFEALDFFPKTLPFFQSRKSLQGVRESNALFRDLQETLESGQLPDPQSWDQLRFLAFPWGSLAPELLQNLRDQGGALLPTLIRLRKLTEQTERFLKKSQSQSAQAMAQVGSCLGLVPVVSISLGALLPVLKDGVGVWGGLSFLSFLGCGLGAYWLFQLSESARWGGMKHENRSWILGVPCALESLLAWVKAGQPPDLAWVEMMKLLESQTPSLVQTWGNSPWEKGKNLKGTGLEKRFFDLGDELKRAIQVSLFEGRACGDRIEGLLKSLQQDIQIHIETETGMLSTRAMKPLFLCVAPSILFLIASAFYLTWESF